MCQFLGTWFSSDVWSLFNGFYLNIEMSNYKAGLRACNLSVASVKRGNKMLFFMTSFLLVSSDIHNINNTDKQIDKWYTQNLK